MIRNLQLKHLIITLIVMVFIFLSVSNLVTSYRWNVKMLEDKALETNRIYAQKLAQVVDLYLKDTFQLLQYSANEFTDVLDNEQKLQLMVDDFLNKDKSFSTVAVISTEGELLAGAPQKRLTFKNRKLNFAPEGLKMLHQKEPYISKPHTSPTGQEVIIISQPLFSESGKHIAVLAVTIYIHDKQNAFHTILGTHYYNDGSYVFVVDSEGRIIYHKDPVRLDDVVTENLVVQRVMNGERGASSVTNTKGIDMLAGYSVSSIASWGIISQTPVEVAIAPAGKQVLQMFLSELPMLIVALIISLFVAAKIVQPLRKIAEITEDSVEQSELKKLHQLGAWYYEAQQIKYALITSFSFLHDRVNYFMDQSNIDPLTKLTNRRTLDDVLNKWAVTDAAFAVVIMDIDHFKRINDKFGHAIGDQVLQFFANEIVSGARQQDICCRFGGEEFIILLPATTAEEAYLIVDSIRINMEKKITPCGERISFSAGIACYPNDASNIKELLLLSDYALYEAKRNGRNQTVIHKNDI